MDREPAGPPALSSLAAIFLRTGNLTFGGGDPTMTALQRELVDNRGWLSPSQYTLLWSLARVTPGTNVLAFCAGAGWMLGGWPGAVIGAFGSCLPAAVLVAWLTAGFDHWESNRWVAPALRGISASVVGMMAAGAVMLLRPWWALGARLLLVATFVLAFVASAWFDVSPAVIILVAASVGWFRPGSAEAPSSGEGGER